MDVKTSKSIENIIYPPIVLFKKVLQEDPRYTPPLLDLTQAVPSYGPPSHLREKAAAFALETPSYFYTQDEGLTLLREKIASRHEKKNCPVSADSVLITAGANMAFLIALKSIIEPGDEVIVPLPYYFNHDMAIKMCHGIPRYVYGKDTDNFVPSLEEMEKAITPKTRAMVIVSPNNPTGVIFPEERLEDLYHLCRKKGIFLIHDETYEEFDEEEYPHFSLVHMADWQNTIISIHSFSKTYSLTGLRVGYILCHEKLLHEMMKVQDTVVICAPHFSQLLALEALHSCEDWLHEKKHLMHNRLISFRKAFSNCRENFSLVCSGAFFGYVKHHFTADSRTVAHELAIKTGIHTLPGTFFGPGQEKYLRFAFGNAASNDIALITDALQDFVLT